MHLSPGSKIPETTKVATTVLPINKQSGSQGIYCTHQRQALSRTPRYLINFVLHTNPARLHRRFLIRGSTQSKFAYSRMQCIQSTETVLEVQISSSAGKMWGASLILFSPISSWLQSFWIWIFVSIQTRFGLSRGNKMC